ncbi:MAG: DUF3662 domain-containing protein [Thermoleophilia bacterium]|nr:DUF3662 domain-containing protein [Thermoleophilia bacterium]
MARKLVKEMEDHKVSRSAYVSVRNRYTVYLCPEDYERLRDHEEALLAKFERHLSRHVKSKGYRIAGDIAVSMTVDHDLRLGYFGILAERDAPGLVEQEIPVRMRDEEPIRGERVVAQGSERVATARVPIAQEKQSAAVGGATAIIAPDDAARLGLARQTIVVANGEQTKEFNQGRIILGRARDVDFVIDSPDVSRRHAMLYWSNGDVVLEDLGSTNGTMVNGYPISSTVVGPGDVVVIGDCRLNVRTR